MKPIETSVMFDMRAPAFGTPPAELYAEALNMAAFADEIGVTNINLMEHHASADGYLPQPFVMGGGVAARTQRCRLTLGAIILPLHDPVQVAEQIGVLDLMSSGRLMVTFGAGYVAEEFAAFGASLKDRARPRSYRRRCTGRWRPAPSSASRSSPACRATCRTR